MEEGLQKVLDLQERARRIDVQGSRMFNPGWHMCRDLRNLLVASEAIARSALSRKESRGAHSRIDYPKMEAEWSKVNTSVFKKGDEMALEHTPGPEMPEELKKLFVKKEPAHA